MKYRSEIRDSQIRDLKEKVEKRDYRKYLLEMTLHKLRAFQKAQIRFRFPVTALIGPNAGGKSTVLGAAALMYKEAKPSQFFPISSIDDEAMQGIKIGYRLIDREMRREGEFERSVTRPQDRWSRDALKRRLLFFGVRRTIPANERSEFSKFRTGVKALAEDDYLNLDSEVVSSASRILRIDISRYSKSQSRSKKPLIGYAGEIKHSQFHFGSGVSVIIELVSNLEELKPEDQALVLIEEIENTLHPYAVRRLVEYLIGVSERKRCQIIFTTHSEYALDPLPREAIWAARDGVLVNGRLHVQDLLAFRGEADTRLAIYCEDAMAVAWLQGIMRYGGITDEMALVEFFPVGGFGDVINYTHNHNNDPSRRFRAIGFVDGNTPLEEELGPEVYRLPGQHMPEDVIMEVIRANYSKNLGILTVGLGRKPEEQEYVRRVIEMEMQATDDMHLIFTKIGTRLGFLPEATVTVALISAYCLSQSEEVRRTAQIIQNAIRAGENNNHP